MPTSHGYQHVLAELHHVRAHTFFQPTLWHAPAPPEALGGLELVDNSLARYRHDGDYPPTPALQNHPEYPSVAYCDDSYAFAALDFVREQGQNYNATGQPFFGLLAVQIPHAPFHEVMRLPEWDAAYTDDPQFAASSDTADLSNQTRQWAAMVTRIDAHFGNILAALEDPNHDGDTSDSIAENTLIVFQSDNGGPGGDNLLELDANGGLRGTKGRIQEGGIRVPLVMRWPAKIHGDSALLAGTNSNMVVDVTDLLPTFCELAGAEIPLGIDGVSIAPTLTGGGHQRRRDFIIHEASNGRSIIRGDIKLVCSGGSGRQKPSFELFDLSSDPSEANNIAAKHPELVKELEQLLLGERVTEPKGFANTYHHWTGADGASTADPDNWSDYEYANAGISYMIDKGAPQLSWIARMENSSDLPATARAVTDLETLGLEIRGNRQSGAEQTLVLGPDITLTGRNEIRVAEHGKLIVGGGRVSSLRWVDVRSQGTLHGAGIVDCKLYNNGIVFVSGQPTPQLEVLGDYHQSATGSLVVPFSDQSLPALIVSGEASLAGALKIDPDKVSQLAAGESMKVLSARSIRGSFDNEGQEIVTPTGTRLAISYTDSAVMLTVKP